MMQVPPGATNATLVDDVIDADENEEMLDLAVGTPSDEYVDVN